MTQPTELLDRLRLVTGMLRELRAKASVPLISNDLLPFVERVERIASSIADDRTDRGRVVANTFADGMQAKFDRLQALIEEAKFQEIGPWFDNAQADLLEVLELSASEGLKIPSKEPSSSDVLGLFATDSIDVVERASRDYRRDRELSAAVSSARRALDEVNSSAEKAKDSADLAAVAAGSSGSASLSEHFKDFADRELATANWFRYGTLTSLVIAAALAVYFPFVDRDINLIVSHAIQVAAVAGLGTFLGAQASGHRRTGNWSRALEVQLKSFEAFIEPIRDTEAYARLYETFGHRLLGSPPVTSSARGANASVLAKIAEAALRR